MMNRAVSESSLCKTKLYGMASFVLSPNWIQFRSFRSNFGGRKATIPGKLRIKATISAPWLLLPPVVKCEDMYYKFCTMSEKKSWKKTRVDGDEQVPPHNAKLVGSSHGWVASFDDDTNHVFLSNPISGRHIKLPPISSLPFPEINLLNGRGTVSRLTLTCSPDDDDCRAVIIYGPLKRLAYCAPRAAAADWTPIGKPYYWFFLYSGDGASTRDRSYTDFVYSPRQKLLFCLMEGLIDFEGWDLTDPLHPQLHWIFPAVDRKLAPSIDVLNSYSFHTSRLKVAGGWFPRHPWPKPEDPDRNVDHCYCLHYLVLAPHSDDLFHVVRYVTPRLRPDGSSANRVVFLGKFYPNFDYRYPYKTVSFDVYKLDCGTQKLTYMAGGSLGGLAMFVGMSDSFALPAADYPTLKPDSIYFTDEDCLLTPSWTSFGGHDNGVFDYRAKVFSSCCDCYPNDYHRIRRIVPPPMWYTP